MNQKIGALFVLYNPSEKELLNIIRMSLLYDITYVYDNTEYKVNYIDKLRNSGIQYFGYRRNDGLSIAYNFILKRAILEEIEWLSLYDQDSIISEEMVNRLKKFAENVTEKNIACLVPYIQYSSVKPNYHKTREITWSINSGQMLNIKNIIKKGLRFDENLFLDRVDRDFCKQIELAELKIIQVGDTLLKQKLGVEYKGYNIHSALRNYYIAKNRLYYNNKYYGKILGNIFSIFQTTKQIINILIVGKNTKENILMIKEGCKDYFLGNLGKKEI